MLVTTQQMNAPLNKEITTDDCRVCLSSNKNNKFIYSTTITNEYDNCEVELKEILQLHGGIELAENDGLPSCICQECFFKVHTANKLWKQCQLTDRKLQAIYEKPEEKQSEFNSQLATEEPCQTNDSTKFLTDETDNKQSDGIMMNENIPAKLSINMSSIECTQIQNEAADAKDNLWTNRPRRLSMFKRMTSMKTLTDNKERQRNHMKNNKNSTKKSDNILNNENPDNSVINTEDNEKRPQKYQCSQCDEKYSSKKSLYRHCLTHDEETKPNSYDKSMTPPNCNICNKVFRKTTTMIQHLNIHKKTHSTDVYNILKDMRTKRESECLSNKTSHSSIARKNHKKSKINQGMTDRTKHNSPQNSPDPKTTIKLINTWIKEELSTSKSNSISKSKEYCCSVCGKFYMTKKTLLKHHHDQHERKIDKIRIKTMKENNTHKVDKQSNEYQCDECNKTFNKELQFQRHMKVHDNNKQKSSVDADFKRFLCHICSKTFRQNTGLMFHMRTHTGYKPHECKFCGRGFTSNSNCINHERTHTGDRPFVCHFCSAAFAKSCTLKSHITTHTGEANYHCKTCGKSFRRLKYLKEHKFTHTGEKPYVCKICGTAYSHSGSLFVHEKKCKAQLNSYQPTTTTNDAIGPQIYSKTNDGTIVAEFNNPLVASVANKNYNENVQGTNPGSRVCNNIIEHSVNISMTENAIQSLPISNQMFNS